MPQRPRRSSQRHHVSTDEPALWQDSILKARAEPVEYFAKEVLQLKALPGEALLTDPFPRRLDSWQLDAWQCELLEAIADVWRAPSERRFNLQGHTTISCRALQGPGKTFGVALAMHLFAYCWMQAVLPCTAPKLEHLKTRLWKEFRKIQHRARAGYAQLMHVDTTRITWMKDPDWFATAETASQPEAMQGLRGKYTLASADEASGIAEAIFPVIMGALASTKVGILLEIGNPTRNIGTFADHHRRIDKSRDCYLMHIGPQNTSRVNPEWIAKMVRQYGPKSPAVLVRCYGEFAESGKNQLVSYEWVQAALDRVPLSDGSHPRVRVSVDVADGGEDESVVTGAHKYLSGTRLKKQRAYNLPHATGVIMLADHAEEMFDELGGKKGDDDIVVDGIGPGAGTCGELIRRGHAVIRYAGGSASSDPKKWRNRRVQSYMAMRNALRDGTMTIDDEFVSAEEWVELQAQICSIRSRPGAENFEDLITKEQMITDGIKSPDRADSIAMQFATQVPTLHAGAANHATILYAPQSERIGEAS